MSSLKGKTLFITGASRGIGHAIGLRAAKDGANVVIVAKTTEPNPKLPGTIYTAAEDMVKAGGQALALAVDIRDGHWQSRHVEPIRNYHRRQRGWLPVRLKWQFQG